MPHGRAAQRDEGQRRQFFVAEWAASSRHSREWRALSASIVSGPSLTSCAIRAERQVAVTPSTTQAHQGNRHGNDPARHVRERDAVDGRSVRLRGPPVTG